MNSASGHKQREGPLFLSSQLNVSIRGMVSKLIANALISLINDFFIFSPPRPEGWIPPFLNPGSGVSEGHSNLVFHMALLNGGFFFYFVLTLPKV